MQRFFPLLVGRKIQFSNNAIWVFTINKSLKRNQTPDWQSGETGTHNPMVAGTVTVNTNISKNFIEKFEKIITKVLTMLIIIYNYKFWPNLALTNVQHAW